MQATQGLWNCPRACRRCKTRPNKHPSLCTHLRQALSKWFGVLMFVQTAVSIGRVLVAACERPSGPIVSMQCQSAVCVGVFLGYMGSPKAASQSILVGQLAQAAAAEVTGATVYAGRARMIAACTAATAGAAGPSDGKRLATQCQGSGVCY